MASKNGPQFVGHWISLLIAVTVGSLNSLGHHPIVPSYQSASTAIALPLKGPMRVIPRPPKRAKSLRVRFLAQLIQAEAGNQPFLVRLCVGDVVLNRMQTAGFPHHLRQVILQPGQFSSVSNGMFAQATPTPQTLRAAQNALNGWNPVPTALYFFNPSLPHSPWMNTLTACQPFGSMVFCR